MIVAPGRRYHDIRFKRLEIGSFQLPTAPSNAVSIEMTPTQLSLIFSSIELRSATKAVPTSDAGGRESIASPLKQWMLML